MKLRRAIQLSFLLFSLTIWFSCDKQENQFESEKPIFNQTLTVQTVSIEQAENKTELESRINQIIEDKKNQKQSLSSKVNKGIYVDKQSISLIKEIDYTSYTFRIYREEYPELFENLIITNYKDEYNSHIMSYELNSEQYAQMENNSPILGDYQVRIEKIDFDFGDIVSKETCYKYEGTVYHSNPEGNWKFNGDNCPHYNSGNFEYCKVIIKWTAVAVACPETLDAGPSSGGGGVINITNGGIPDSGLPGSSSSGDPLTGTGLSDSNGDDVLTVATTGALGTPATVAHQLGLSINQSQWFGGLDGFSAFITVFEFLEANNNSQAAINAAKKAIGNITRSTDLTSLNSIGDHKLYADIASQLIEIYSGLVFTESNEVVSELKKDNSLTLSDWNFITNQKNLSLREFQYSYYKKQLQFDNSNLEKITKTETTVALFSHVKNLLGQYWPKNSDEWGALFDLMSPLLLEIGVEFIPGGGAFNSGKDALAGINSGDYQTAALGVVGLIMEFVPWTKLAKIGKKVYDVGKKVFAIFRTAYKFLDQVASAVKSGLKTVLGLSNDVLLKKNNLTIGRISNNILTFYYKGYGGNLITNPNKTTTVLGRFNDAEGFGTEAILNNKLFKYGENKGGFNLLNEPSTTWSTLTQSQKDAINKQWLKKGFERGDDIRLISNPTTNSFSGGFKTQYGKELDWINEFKGTYNYTFDSTKKIYKKN